MKSMNEMVSAGDIEKYAYCPLSWWLSKKHKSVYLEGVRKHKEAGRELEEIMKKEKIIRLYEKYILLISIVATIVSLLGISFIYGKLSMIWNKFFIIISLLWIYNSLFFLYKEGKASTILKRRYERIILVSSIGAMIVALFSIFISLPPNPSIGRFAEILSLLWIASANLIFYRSLNISEEVIEKKIKYAPVDGKIEYIGNSSQVKEIVSEKYGIRGKPDYIVKIGNEYIPVEEKSMQSDHPKFSHVMQITAYCMMVEDVYGKEPPYGIIKYENRQFKIPYEERWKKVVERIRKNILRDIKRGYTHRNHHNIKKCERCARRQYCPEKLI